MGHRAKGAGHRAKGAGHNVVPTSSSGGLRAQGKGQRAQGAGLRGRAQSTCSPSFLRINYAESRPFIGGAQGYKELPLYVWRVKYRPRLWIMNVLISQI